MRRGKKKKKKKRRKKEKKKKKKEQTTALKYNGLPYYIGQTIIKQHSASVAMSNFGISGGMKL